MEQGQANATSRLVIRCRHVAHTFGAKLDAVDYAAMVERVGVLPRLYRANLTYDKHAVEIPRDHY